VMDLMYMTLIASADCENIYIRRLDWNMKHVAELHVATRVSH
jgi:hypothetical protein